MILKGIQDSALALEFMKAVAPNMSIFNTDGIGYSAINSKNKLFSEKWHNNRQFMQLDTVVDSSTLEALAPYKSRLPDLTLNYKSYGKVTRDDLRTVTMHTRFATCGKQFENTHPFIDNDMSLIHNGVISNSHTLGLNKISTCDSENALQLYNNEKLNTKNKVEDFQAYIDKLKGYWAFAILAKNAKGVYMLDVVRETASLYWTLLPELGEDCAVFATTMEIIETGVKALGLKPRNKIYSLMESNYHRFNAVTGEFIENFPLDDSALNSFGYQTYYNKKWRNKDTKTVTKKEDIEIVEEIPQLPTVPTVDEIFEGYTKENDATRDAITASRSNFQGTNLDEPSIDEFYDTNTPLLDRFFDYDKLMGTSYGNSFEDLPARTRAFIERKEEDNYIDFDDTLLMIEFYQESDGKISGIYDIYREKKKA